MTEPLLRVPRRLRLTEATLLDVLKSHADYGVWRIVLSDLAFAFEGCWSAGGTPDPKQRQFDCFATQLFVLLRSLDRRRLVDLHFDDPTRLIWRHRVFVEALDTLDGVSPGLASHLADTDRERIQEPLEADDFTWTPSMLANAHLEIRDGARKRLSERVPQPTGILALAVIGVEALEKVMNEILRDPHFLRGVSSSEIQRRLGVDGRFMGEIDAFLESAQDDGIVYEAVTGRWLLIFENSRKGPAAILHRLAWTREGLSMTRAQLAKALAIRPQALTRPIRKLIESGLLESGVEGMVSASKCRPAALRWLVEEMLAQEMSVRRIVPILKNKGVPEEAAIWMIDDLTPDWLEGGRYSPNGRPYRRVSLSLKLRLTPKALFDLGRCAICSEPWGAEPLRRRRADDGWGAVVHARCPDVRCACPTCDHARCEHDACAPGCDHLACIFTRPMTSCKAAECTHERCDHVRCEYRRCDGRCEERACDHSRCTHARCNHTVCQRDCPTLACTHASCQHPRCQHIVCNHRRCGHSLRRINYKHEWQARCASCNGEFSPVDDSPIRGADLAGGLSAFVEGWEGLLMRVHRAEPAITSDLLAARLKGVRARISKVESCDLRELLGLPVWEFKKPRLAKYLRETDRFQLRPLGVEWGLSLRSPPTRGGLRPDWDRLATAVAMEKKRRDRGLLFAHGSVGFVHPECLGQLTR